MSVGSCSWSTCNASSQASLHEERCRPMSREPALEVGGCPPTRHRPQVRRVTHTRHTHTRFRSREQQKNEFLTSIASPPAPRDAQPPTGIMPHASSSLFRPYRGDSPRTTPAAQDEAST
eukprot:4847469-Prymnesium_polylepis.1